ncbi:MAG TPA: ATP-dependent DNA ligase [Nitrososphaeraceae archaeon]
MDFSVIVSTLEKMEKTSRRLELTDCLVSLFKNTPPDILDKVIYLIQGKVAPDYEGIELGLAEKMIIKAVVNSSGVTTEKLNQIYQKTGDLGDTTKLLMGNKLQTTLVSEQVTVERIYSTFFKISKTLGTGSQEIKLRLLSSLLNDSASRECKYIVKFALGTLRLGVADYSILDALSLAFTNDKKSRSVIESGYNVLSDLGKVGKLLATGGLSAIASLRIQPFIPIRPMLAERVRTAEEILEKMNGRAAAEYKIDGERVQIHISSNKTEIFSRRLENITSHYPDIVKSVSKIGSKHIIVEAEVVAIEESTGEFLPFQELMHRRRKYNISEAVKRYPISLNLFDILYKGGHEVTQLPYSERRSMLESIARKTNDPTIKIIPQKIVQNAAQIEKLMSKAIESGCEGLMLKQIDSPYRAGARGYAWTKIKREYRSEIADTLDLVVVGALFGRGRRTGKYGALLLSAYDQKSNKFNSICKVGSGFKDIDLETLFKELEPYCLKNRHPNVNSNLEMDVWFEPSVVIEVIASEITLSPSHSVGMNKIRSGFGLSLRFPKFTGKIRFDKNAEDCTSDDELIAMYKQQLRAIKTL